MTRALWDWLDTEHARNVILVALAAPFVSLALGFAFPGLRNVALLAISPGLAALGYEASRGNWRWLITWQMVLVAVILTAASVFFLISPSYLARLP
jgi:hypothetical protein